MKFPDFDGLLMVLISNFLLKYFKNIVTYFSRDMSRLKEVGPDRLAAEWVVKNNGN